MKTKNATSNRWLRHISAIMAVLIILLGWMPGIASARILFQDDTASDIDSEGIILNSDDGGDEDVTLQFGNDATDATITFDDGLSDLIFTGAGMDWSAVDQFRIRENADPASNSACDFKGELIYDTTDDELQICTATGIAGAATWASVDTTGGTATLQSAYNNETATDREILISADNNPVEVRASAAGDDLLELHANDNSVLIGFNDLGGTTIDINSLVVDWDATGAFSLDSTAGVHIGGANPSDFTVASDGAGDDLTIAVTGATDSSVVISSSGTGTDAIDINATAGGIDIDTTNGAFAVTAGGAANGDITLNSADTMTLDVDGDGVIDIEEGLNFDVGANLDMDIEGTGAFTLNTADGSVTIGAAGAVNGDIIMSAGDDFTLDAVGLLELNSSAGAISIGNDDIDQAVNIGTNGERTVTIGNTNGATALDFNANGAITMNSDDGSVTIGADDTDNAGNDNVVLLSGNAAPDAGEDGNDIAIEAEDDVLIEATGNVDIDSATMDITTSGQFAINTSAWDITGAGAASGFTTISSSGNITTSGGTFIVGTTALNETTAANDSGAYLVGAFDEFDNSASTNVQDVLDDLDALIGANAPLVETLRFYPEYPEAIYDTSDKGKMESVDDAAEGNSYKWTTKQNSDQVMTIVLRTELPADFSDPNDLTLRFKTKENAAADNTVGLELYNITDSAQCAIDNNDDATNFSNNAWTTLTLAEAAIETGCTGGTVLGAGDIIEFRIFMMADDTNDGEAYVGYVDLGYDN